ncbi:MAG: AAA family ATPase [Verrucomicrobia bacterium]|nr:MAG: AAA family ATPase [Verrucomicrobiota bacterium]
MYLNFYGLSEMPFNITPDPRFLFLSTTHKEAIQHLKYGVEAKKGFIVLIGEVGCGKTTLCRQFLNELPEEKYDTALILNPRISETQLLKIILTELGEEVTARTNQDLLSQVYTVLLERIHAGRDIVLIVDECQNLTFEVLEQLRLLSNLETDQQKLLQIVLIGQPEFKEKLAENRLRQLRQRILVSYELKPLTVDQVRHYIRHRLALAGGTTRPRFSNMAVRAICKAAQGIPRVINNICDRALMAAFVRESDEVSYWDVRRAIREYRSLDAA